MGTKTISITRKKLSDFQGILSKESADELEKNIKKARKEHAKARELRIKRIKEAFK